METFTKKLKQFFAPAVPLWNAIVTFAKTTLGITVGVVIILCCIIRITTAINHYHFRQEFKHSSKNYKIREYHVQDNGGYYYGNGIIMRR